MRGGAGHGLEGRPRLNTNSYESERARKCSREKTGRSIESTSPAEEGVTSGESDRP